MQTQQHASLPLQARDFARAAQGHAEGAARELLAAKKAEIQAAALLNGGKNPDPASTEVLKAQAAAKCADQLKVGFTCLLCPSTIRSVCSALIAGSLCWMDNIQVPVETVTRLE